MAAVEAGEASAGIYFAKMINEKIKRNLILTLLLGTVLLVSGCPSHNDKVYPVAGEEYLLGWVLHNIDESTPTDISYTYGDLAVYNYSFNYPANASHTYDNVMFWFAPFENSGASSWLRLAVPQNRVYYLKGDKVPETKYRHGWSFSNHMQINYLTSEDSFLQSQLDVAHKEHYKSESPFNAITPVPGEKEHIYFGTSPFTPASVIVNGNVVSLNGNLLSGYSGKSYLKRYRSGFDLPMPKYKIYLDNALVEDGNLTDYPYSGYDYEEWNYAKLNRYLEQTGNYEIDVQIPSSYPVFKETKIKTAFFKDSNKYALNLPVIKHIEFPSRFEINKLIPISLEFENEESVGNVSMYYKTDAMPDWSLLGNSKTAELVISGQNAKEINFKFDASTQDGTATYEIYPVSLKAIDVNCTHSISKEEKNIVYGQCTDANQNPVNGIKIEIYSGDKFLGSAMTDYAGQYNFEADGSAENIDVKFKGTGVYNSRGQLEASNAVCGNGICLDHQEEFTIMEDDYCDVNEDDGSYYNCRPCLYNENSGLNDICNHKTAKTTTVTYIENCQTCPQDCGKCPAR